jgi:hypothetical protein
VAAERVDLDPISAVGPHAGPARCVIVVDYLGLLLSGPKRAVNKLTGSLPLLR